jgi:hypothetical protein
MLNPDGVIVGNYRCSLMGQDLNRQWIGSSSKFYPINYHTKLMMKRTLESRDIFFYCDFHGHSIGRNAFMFGNNQPKVQDRNKEKIFPMLFQQKQDMFCFEGCCFAVQKSKEACGRQVMWREFNLINSFTLEVSFMGPNRGRNAGLHFNTKMCRDIGKDFCETMVDYVQNHDLVSKILAELKVRYPQGGTSGAAGADFPKMIENTEQPKQQLTPQQVKESQHQCQIEEDSTPEQAPEEEFKDESV